MSAVTIGAVIVLVGLISPTVRDRHHIRSARASVREGGRGVPPRPARITVEGELARIAGRVNRRHRSTAQPAQALATMLDEIARRSASGHSLAAAFAAATAHRSGDDLFRRTNAAMRTGATIDEALAHEQSGHPDTALAVHVLRLCALQGGHVSESLDRAAATLRERHAASQERIAQAAQARLSAKVLTVVPIAFASWTLITSSSVQQFMITPAGVVCAATGIALNLLGWSLMNRAIRGRS